MTQHSNYEWVDSLKQFKPIGWKNQPKTQMGERTMTEATNKTEVQVYELTRKSGRVDKIRFTGKREQILNLMKEGKSNDDVVAAGFSKNTVLVVRWQGKTLGILAGEPEAAEPAAQ